MKLPDADAAAAAAAAVAAAFYAEIGSDSSDESDAISLPPITCFGCLLDLGNQQAHMGPGGCLEELDDDLDHHLAELDKITLPAEEKIGGEEE